MIFGVSAVSYAAWQPGLLQQERLGRDLPSTSAPREKGSAADVAVGVYALGGVGVGCSCRRRGG